METWLVVLLVTGAAVGMVGFTYVLCTTMLQSEEALQRWVTQNGFRLIRREQRFFFQGPFSLGYPNQYRCVYFVTIEDDNQQRKTGWVRVGWWYIVGFKENVQVRWDK
jgi:hypothetical protein